VTGGRHHLGENERTLKHGLRMSRQILRAFCGGGVAWIWTALYTRIGGDAVRLQALA
jgi:hypothetical protein